MRAYIFDIDGTLSHRRALSPSRSKIDPTFEKWFLNFCLSHEVHLVTGGDYPKTLERVGEDIVNAVKRCYNCSGSSVWENGVEVWHNEFKITDQQEKWLQAHLNNSNFPIRTGLHFEYYPGVLSFSIVGRNTNSEERREYIEYDERTRERYRIADQFNEQFEGVYATFGGETSLDIAQLGMDKSQILRDFDNTPITFFGDQMEEGGNDFSLKYAITKRNNEGDMLHPVTDWQHTWELLKEEGQ